MFKNEKTKNIILYQGVILINIIFYSSSFHVIHIYENFFLINIYFLLEVGNQNFLKQSCIENIKIYKMNMQKVGSKIKYFLFHILYFCIHF